MSTRELPGLDRRAFLRQSASLAALPLLGRFAGASVRPRFADDPFSLGVASGDPAADGFVLWTRLAPKPLEPGGGLGREVLEVGYEIAEDEGWKKVVRKGRAFATPQLGHSVHVELAGLEPDRWYWYRFRAGDAESAIGRARTFPAREVLPARLRFAVTSCQNYEQGLFTAYEQMLADDPDLVFHLGDYIYEYAAGKNGKVRTHLGGEIATLDDYRVRHAQYRSDPLLQRMHASCPWLVTWDDHEVDNNYADSVSEEKGVAPEVLLARRANAYQAYYEMMPLRARSLPRGPHLRLHRSASFGRLAELLVLDTRQYRSDQPNGDGKKPLNDAALAASNTLLGAEQRDWLQGELLASPAVWNVLAQQVMMALVGLPKEGGEPLYSMDQWPGYAAERASLLRFLHERRIPNPVVLTGDIHSAWANELRIEDRDPSSPRVATEFVATSLSSGGNGTAKPKYLDELYARHPGVKHHDQERGYLRCTLTPQRLTTDFMVVDEVEKPGGKTAVRASFAVEAGAAELRRV
jgi:alkaline phosphatase D